MYGLKKYGGDNMCITIDFGCSKYKEEIDRLNKLLSPPIPPEYLKDLTINEVYTILLSEFPEATLYLSDNKYKTVSKEQLKAYLHTNQVSENKYVSEYYDCDDFSFALMGELSNPEWGALPFGILWTKVPGGAHAVNCFIDSDHEVWIIEPQNDSIFKLPPDWVPYLVIM